MSNITLPTSGSTNWGAGLNHYLDNLRIRMEKIENSINAQNDNSAKLIGFAGSGAVGECTISYNSSKKAITFDGHVYISGANPSYHQLSNSEYNISIQLQQITDNNPRFVFLKKNDSNFEISIKENFTDIDYSYILIGSIIKKGSSFNFQRYYYSSGKTLIQHQYELQHGWADLDSNNCALKLTVTNSLPSVSIEEGGYVIYCGGVGQTNIRLTNTTSIGGTPSITEIAKKYYFKDAPGNTTPTFLGTSNIQLAPDGEAGYYRLLVDIFGNFIIQKSSITDRLADESIALAEQQLLNASFLKIDTWQAAFPIEILRFGYNKETITNNEYTQGFSTSGFSGFHVVKSIDNGIAPQLRDRIYLQQNNSVWLDSTQFKNDVYQNSNLKLRYEAGNGSLNTYFYLIEPNIVVDSEWITVSNNDYYEFKDYKSDDYKIPITFRMSKKTGRTIIVHGWNWRGETSIDTTLESIITYGSSVEFLITEGEFAIYLEVTCPDDDIYECSWRIDGPEEFKTEYSEAEQLEYIFRNFLRDAFIPSIEIQDKVNSDQVDFDCSTIESGNGIVLWEKTKTPRSIRLLSDDIFLGSGERGLSVSPERVTAISSSFQLSCLPAHSSLGLNSYYNGEWSTHLSYNSSCYLHLKSSEARLYGGNSWLSLNSNEILMGNNLRMYSGKSMTISNGNLTLTKGNLTLTQGDLTLTQGNILLNNGHLDVASDIRLKDNINIIKNNFTDVVKNVSIYNFNYKNSKELCIGMIAQELYSILPDKYKDVFVKQYSSSYLPDQLAISETKLIYLLWAAFQEEISKREKLEQRVNSLGV